MDGGMDRWIERERGEMRGESERRSKGEGEDIVSMLFKTIQGKKTHRRNAGSMERSMRR